MFYTFLCIDLSSPLICLLYKSTENIFKLKINYNSSLQGCVSSWICSPDCIILMSKII